MSGISVTSDHRNERVLAQIEDLGNFTRRSIRRAWFELGKDLKAEANKEILRRPKSGRTYFIRGPTGRRRRHVASAPGETHANITGKLRRSVSWKTHGTDSMDFGYGVSTTAKNVAPEYAPFVEFGTRQMGERPSLDNSITATQRRVQVHFEDAMREELSRR